MATATALRIQLLSHPGDLARVSRVLADAGVNLQTLAGLTY
jgi:hypothetical protein